VDPLRLRLASLRRRIVLGRAADAAARGAFHASLAACALLAASKFLGAGFGFAAAACAAVPLAFALRAALRPFGLRDCAVHLDRALGLEERLATALEASGAMKEALEANAADALSRSPLPRWRAPREARLLAGSLLAVAALFAVPTFERRAASADPVLRAVVEEEAARLAELGKLEAEFREVAELVRREELERALDRIEAIRTKLAERAAEAGGGGAGTQKLLDEAGASAGALSAELARRGRRVHAPAPVAAEVKLRRQFAEEPREFADPAGGPLPAATAAVLGRKDWDLRYDPVIRRYFGSRR
jgi:hypothetical protein